MKRSAKKMIKRKKMSELSRKELFVSGEIYKRITDARWLLDWDYQRRLLVMSLCHYSMHPSSSDWFFPVSCHETIGDSRATDEVDREENRSVPVNNTHPSLREMREEIDYSRQTKTLTGIECLSLSQRSSFPVGALFGLVQSVSETKANQFRQAFLFQRRLLVGECVWKDIWLILIQLVAQWDSVREKRWWGNFYLGMNHAEIEERFAREQCTTEHGIRGRQHRRIRAKSIA